MWCLLCFAASSSKFVFLLPKRIVKTLFSVCDELEEDETVIDGD